MEKNKFIFEPSTAEVINKFLIKSGYGTIDCNASRVYANIKNSSDNYDQTNGRPILKSEFVYLNPYSVYFFVLIQILLLYGLYP